MSTLNTAAAAAAAAAATLLRYRVILMIEHDRDHRRHRHHSRRRPHYARNRHTRYVGTRLLTIRGGGGGGDDAYTVAELIVALGAVACDGDDATGTVAALRGLPVNLVQLQAAAAEVRVALPPTMRLVAPAAAPAAAAAVEPGGIPEVTLFAFYRDASMREFPRESLVISWDEQHTSGATGARKTRLGMFYPRDISGAALASAAASALELDPRGGGGGGKYVLATEQQMAVATARGRVGMWDTTLEAAEAAAAAATDGDKPFGQRYRGTTLHLVRARVDPARAPLSVVFTRTLPPGVLDVAPWLANVEAFDPRELVQVRVNDVVAPPPPPPPPTVPVKRHHSALTSALIANTRIASMFSNPAAGSLSSDEAPELAVDALSLEAERPAKRARNQAETEQAMRALLECPVCYEVPSRPCVPACGHLVCQRCHILIRAEVPGGVYVCPVCRRRAPARCDGASASSAGGTDNERLRVFYELAALVAHM